MWLWTSLVHIMGAAARTLTYGAGASFLVLSLLSPRSRRARLYLNVLLYVASLGICSVIGVVTSPIMTLLGKATNINYLVARSFHVIAGNLTGLRFKIEGNEKFERARPAVVVGNHQTGVDILYLGAVFPKQASIMAKQELKFAPLLGQFMYLSGAVFINRADRKNAVQAFDRVAKQMKKLCMSLWVFPEGTRSNLPFPDLLPFKKGAFHLAVQAQVPIVPVVCENYNRFFDGKTRFEAGEVRVRILDPIDTKGLTPDDVTDLTTRVRQVMLAELQKMDAELERGDVSSQQAGKAPKTGYLGGVAKLASYLVGEGPLDDAASRAVRQRKKLVNPGTSGENPKDFGLVSEEGKEGKSTAVQAGGSSISSAGNVAHQRPLSGGGGGVGGSSSGSAPHEPGKPGSHSSDETDEGAVFVKRP